jgi:hypothetical protein
MPATSTTTDSDDTGCSTASDAALTVPSESERPRDCWDDKLREAACACRTEASALSSCAIRWDAACVD